MKFTITHFDGITSEVEVDSPGDLLSNLLSKKLTFSISVEDGTCKSFSTPFIVSKTVLSQLQGLVQSKVIVYKSFHPWGREASFLTDVARNYKQHHSVKFSPLISKFLHLNLITAEVVDKRCKNIKVTATGAEAVNYFKERLTYDCINFDDINTIFAWCIWQTRQTKGVRNYVIAKAHAYSLIYYKYENTIIESNEISADLYNIIQPKITDFLIIFWKHWSYLCDQKEYASAHEPRKNLRKILRILLSMVPDDDWAVILTQPDIYLIQDLVEETLLNVTKKT